MFRWFFVKSINKGLCNSLYCETFPCFLLWSLCSESYALVIVPILIIKLSDILVDHLTNGNSVEPKYSTILQLVPINSSGSSWNFFFFSSISDSTVTYKTNRRNFPLNDSKGISFRREESLDAHLSIFISRARLLKFETTRWIFPVYN